MNFFQKFVRQPFKICYISGMYTPWFHPNPAGPIYEKIEQRRLEIEEWCSNNLSGKFWVDSKSIIVEEDDNLVLVKLRFL